MAGQQGQSKRISRRTALGLLSGAALAVTAEALVGQGAVYRWLEPWVTRLPILPHRPPDTPLRKRVGVGYLPGSAGYASAAPFDPAEDYPEYPYNRKPAGRQNDGYTLLREALRGWQPRGFGTPGWNPLAGTIHPGDGVIIKANLVFEPSWGEDRLGLNTVHPSTIRAVIDYVFKACGPQGHILVCEGTATASQWPRLVQLARLRETVDRLRRDYGVPLELVDLNGVTRDEALVVKLGERSMLFPLQGSTLFDLHDQPESYSKTLGLGSYLIAPHPLRADVVVSLAKMKVHQTAGVTMAMKNLFGIIPSWDGPYGDNRLKDVAHYSDRDAAGGPRTLYLENDTTWRTIVDLNQLLLFADDKGQVRQDRQRRYLGIVDGLVAAGTNMFDPVPVPLGLLVVGDTPVSTDAVATRLMGYDPRLVKSIAWAWDLGNTPLGPASPSWVDVAVAGGLSVNEVSDGRVVPPSTAPYSWQGQLEARDFQPPEVDSPRVQSGELRVALKDGDEVAFARVVQTAAGQTDESELTLEGGTPSEGEWRGNLPSGSQDTMVIEAGDNLFNVQRRPIR